jgi:hypothetical protein
MTVTSCGQGIITLTAAVVLGTIGDEHSDRIGIVQHVTVST